LLIQQSAFYFHVHAVKIHHRDEYNTECEKDTTQFMVRLFIRPLCSRSDVCEQFIYPVNWVRVLAALALKFIELSV